MSEHTNFVNNSAQQSAFTLIQKYGKEKALLHVMNLIEVELIDFEPHVVTKAYQEWITIKQIITNYTE